MQGEYVFRRGSNVLEYWLLHAEGFVVRGERAQVGVVSEVVLDPARGLARALVVQSRLLRRRRVVHVRAVDAVDPEARVFELAPKEKSDSVPVTHGPSPVETLADWSYELDRRVEELVTWLQPRLRAWRVTAADAVRR
jgi:hypothetical protein